MGLPQRLSEKAVGRETSRKWTVFDTPALFARIPGRAVFAEIPPDNRDRPFRHVSSGINPIAILTTMAMRWVDYAIGSGIVSGIGPGQPGKRELG